MQLGTIMGFSCGSAGQESACNAGDLGLILGLERSSGEGNGNPLQYSGLENSIDFIDDGVTKSWTWLSNFPLTSLHFSGAIMLSEVSQQGTLFCPW